MNETWLDKIFNKLGLKVRINPLQNNPKNYHNFISVLQASLNDKGLFRPQKISRVKANFFDESGGGKRYRTIFFRDNLCLVIDCNIYASFDSDSIYNPSRGTQCYHRCQHSLTLIHNSLMSKEFLRGETNICTDGNNWTWPVQPHIFNERIGEKMNTLVPEELLLFMELPDNLSFFDQHSSKNRSNFSRLIKIIEYHVLYYQMKYENRKSELEERDLSVFGQLLKTESFDYFVSRYTNDLPRINSDKSHHYNCVLEFDSNSFVTLYGNQFSVFTPNTWTQMRIPKEPSFPVFHKRGRMTIHRYFYTPIFIDSKFFDDQFMFDVAEVLMEYLSLLHEDICKTSQILKSYL